MASSWGLRPDVLANRVALVTGGARGLGSSISRALLEAGADVVTCGRNAPEDLPSSSGRHASFEPCDVRRADDVARLVQSIIERHQRLDIVVNNAGGTPGVRAAEASPRLSESVIALNLLGPLHVSTAAYPHLAASPDGGVIVNIASLSGTRPSPGTAAYGAAKAGLLNLTSSLAMEWGPQVRVNALIVGLVAMEGGDEHYGGAKARQWIGGELPLRRMVEGDDVAAAVLFLASPMGSCLSGASIEVHGGGEPPFFHYAKLATASGG